MESSVALDASSLQERVKASRQAREQAKVVTVPIPGYTGVLAGRYRRPAWRRRREIAEGASGEGSPVDQELCVAADYLQASCEGIDATVDGETHDLAMGLGNELAAWLGLSVGENDRQAVFLIIPDEEDLTDHVETVIRLQREADGRSDEATAGKSVAAGS
jgi:hypothetical protein